MANAFLLFFSLSLLLVACNSAEKQSEKAGKRILRDKLGNEAIVTDGPMKVMGLSPAITEMLFALLPDSSIAAVTPHCNFPPQRVKGRPVISVMPLDLESIVKLKPDLILAEEGITSPSDLNRLKELSLPVLFFSYRRVSDITEAMDSVRVWTKAGPEAAKVCDSLRASLALLEKKAISIPENQRKTILSITWTDPIFAYGAETWMSDKMRLAGGKNVLGQKLGKPYPQLEREQVLSLNPDILFGGSFEKMDSSFFRIYPELKRLKAYRNKQIFRLDDDLASRPGPRFQEGIQEISSRLNPTK